MRVASTASRSAAIRPDPTIGNGRHGSASSHANSTVVADTPSASPIRAAVARTRVATGDASVNRRPPASGDHSIGGQRQRCA